MPKKRRRSEARNVYRSGNSYRPSRYERGRSGLSRPGPSDTYTIDGIEHRWDGRCHEECENVR